MLSYPLHPAGGIRGYNTQEGETGEGQRELPESQRGKVCFLGFFFFKSPPPLCVSALPRNNLSINPCGRGCHVFVHEVLYVVLLSLSLHQWWLSLLRILHLMIFLTLNNKKEENFMNLSAIMM